MIIINEAIYVLYKLNKYFDEKARVDYALVENGVIVNVNNHGETISHTLIEFESPYGGFNKIRADVQRYVTKLGFNPSTECGGNIGKNCFIDLYYVETFSSIAKAYNEIINEFNCDDISPYLDHGGIVFSLCNAKIFIYSTEIIVNNKRFNNVCTELFDYIRAIERKSCSIDLKLPDESFYEVRDIIEDALVKNGYSNLTIQKQND